MGNYVVALVVISLCFGGLFFKFFPLAKKEDFEDVENVFKIDFLFFNNEGLKCRDGQVVNCNLLVYGQSEGKISRENLSLQYMGTLQTSALEKDPDWFFTEGDQLNEFFLSEFQKICGEIRIERLEIVSISYADECFTDNELHEKERNKRQLQVRKEVEERTKQLDREREEQITQLEAERQRAIAKVEEEKKEAIAKLEEGLRADYEKNDLEFQEALKRAEEAKRKFVEED